MLNFKGQYGYAQKIASALTLFLVVFVAQPVIANGLQANSNSGDRVVYRTGYLHGYSLKNSFILQDSEVGFQEIQTLFLGALSAAESIEKCCSNKARKNRISLYLREPFYVVLNDTPVLITSLDLIFPRSFKDVKPYLVMNKELQLHPGEENESFALLLRWANERGYK
jgi:hypothetical protein